MIDITNKTSLVKELFVHTADENYITARWCGKNDFCTDFLWLATHALEKYLKAVLLMNNCPAKTQGHDIMRLYNEAKSVAGALLPDDFTWPSGQSAVDILRPQTTKQFVEHLQKNGNADNRYLMYGYVTLSQDLHMLDQLVFNLRRLICELDARVFDDPAPEYPTFTHREELEKQPQHSFLSGLPLDKLVKEDAPSEAKNAALNDNLAFAPNGYEHTVVRVGSSTRMPVVQRRIFGPLKSSDPKIALEGIESALWFLDNVKVPGGNNSGMVKEIKDAIQSARNTHRIT